ncbi:MAG TPA: DUF1611 domain-containing protein [Steroidobacter sp.]|uniref:DUF1611 domain-containing protein n=1 Tax=Steroidobacter sp. TaxID=1978227 RepID=UPI002ED81335
MGSIELPQRCLIFLGEVTDPSMAKTAFGLRDWAPQRCVGEYSLPGCTVSTGLPRLTPTQARERGADGFIIGVANFGGILAESWIPILLEALGAGLDVVSGMHSRLTDHAQLSAAAQRYGRKLIDVRKPAAGIPVASGRKRTGKRLLTVGTDCALGKKYTALAIARALQARGLPATFRGTGQTGIMIAGAGIPIDAVVADFVAGAAELLTPDAAPEHWDVVEGQGSLFHPSYAGVSLGLLHGTQPDVIVVCHELGRTHLVDVPEYPVPSLFETIDLNLRLARRTNPQARCAGISLNTAALSPSEASNVLEEHSSRLRLPVADPMRGGPAFERLVQACIAQ